MSHTSQQAADEIDRLRKAVDDWHDAAVFAERHAESLQNTLATVTADNAVMQQALACIIDAWDSEDDSMCADPAEIAKSALSQIERCA